MKNPVPSDTLPTRRGFLQSIIAGGAAASLVGCDTNNEPPFNPVYPKGPAIVYTAWAGKSCGTMHNLPALVAAAKTLGVPLYVINSTPENGDIKAWPDAAVPNEQKTAKKLPEVTDNAASNAAETAKSITSLNQEVDEKPGEEKIRARNSRQSSVVLAHYDLTFSDLRVRLIDVDGKPLRKTMMEGELKDIPDVSSNDDLVAAFRPLMAQARMSHSTEQGRGK